MKRLGEVSASGWWGRLRALGAIAVVAWVGSLTALPALAQDSIANTKHNLGTSPGGTGVNRFGGTAEICVFCHTPHGADTSAAVPLWNRNLPAPSSFQTYDSLGTSTLDGRTAPVGSVSIACLSCHDGVTSMSAVINAPGSGRTGDATWQAGTWTGANQVGGAIAPGLISNIGTDLRNDHPIGIQYGGGGLSNSNPSGATRDPDFKAPSTAILGNGRVWWVDTIPNGGTTTTEGRQKNDMVLYTRGTAADNPGYSGQSEPEPFVECASCHDPHSTNSTFLRVSNDGSKVCLACHIK